MHYEGIWEYGGIAPLNFSTIWRWVVCLPSMLLYLPPLLPVKGAPVPTEYEPGWALQLFWMFWKREKTLAPAGIWTMDYPASSLVTVLTTLSQLVYYITGVYKFSNNVGSSFKMLGSRNGTCNIFSADCPQILDTNHTICSHQGNLVPGIYAALWL